jgi:hypothetical protein
MSEAEIVELEREQGGFVIDLSTSAKNTQRIFLGWLKLLYSLIVRSETQPWPCCSIELKWHLVPPMSHR